MICKICKESGKQGHVFVVNDFEDLDQAICANCYQPKRSKREDPTNFYPEIMKEISKNHDKIIDEMLGCGALNSMET